MTGLKVLVVGSGAREHALAWMISQSDRVKELYAAPGNAGTSMCALNIAIPATDIPCLIKKASDLKVDLVVVGPEAPLADGLVDQLQSAGIAAFGPTKAAARLESSKVFSRAIMLKYGIPCAEGEAFSDYGKAKSYLESKSAPIVVKADGLAAGKGVIVATTKAEALAALDSIMQARAFGAAGDQVVIEECLFGKEVSLLAFTDGKTAIPMVPACDYKRVFDDDKGLNTGGMGSYSPPGFFGRDMIDRILKMVIQPVVDAMNIEGTSYQGVLYTGLILTDKGLKVLEFNARFGDPETQVILPRLKTDLVEIMLSVANSKLHTVKIDWTENPCVGVVMASGGYPGDYKTGYPVIISDRLDKDVSIFYAGAKKRDDGKVVTDGGRVLTVTATGVTMREARDRVYRNLPYINFDGCHYRSDIAAREVA